MCLRGFPDGSVVKNPPASAGTAAAKSLQSCLTVWPHRWQPTRLPRPWDSPGKNAGVGCHFLLQCMKVRSESEVAQSCLTLSNLMDCSLRGSSVHGVVQARVLEWDAIALVGDIIYSCTSKNQKGNILTRMYILYHTLLEYIYNWKN